MRLLLLTAALSLPFLSLADAWDNLTKEQADAVVKQLKKHPYILDYCDCCDADGEYATEVFLYKVESAEIVQCEWSPEHYSVQIWADRIAQVPYTEDGINPDGATDSKGRTRYTIFMNYTWTVDVETGMAVPFFEVVDYDIYGDDNKPCRSHSRFPNPKVAPFKHRGYEKWFKKYGKKALKR